MCKYCKNLKRIKDLDEKEYLKIINMWRRKCERAQYFIIRLCSALSETYDDSDGISINDLRHEYLVQQAYEFLYRKGSEVRK